MEGEKGTRATGRGATVEEEEGGGERRGKEEEARLFPGVVVPYLILDVCVKSTETRRLVSNLRRICTGKVTRRHLLPVPSASFLCRVRVTR